MARIVNQQTYSNTNQSTMREGIPPSLSSNSTFMSPFAQHQLQKKTRDSYPPRSSEVRENFYRRRQQMNMVDMGRPSSRVDTGLYCHQQQYQRMKEQQAAGAGAAAGPSRVVDSRRKDDGAEAMIARWAQGVVAQKTREVVTKPSSSSSSSSSCQDLPRPPTHRRREEDEDQEAVLARWAHAVVADKTREVVPSPPSEMADPTTARERRLRERFQKAAAANETAASRRFKAIIERIDDTVESEDEGIDSDHDTVAGGDKPTFSMGRTAEWVASMREQQPQLQPQPQPQPEPVQQQPSKPVGRAVAWMTGLRSKYQQHQQGKKKQREQEEAPTRSEALREATESWRADLRAFNEKWQQSGTRKKASQGATSVQSGSTVGPAPLSPGTEAWLAEARNQYRQPPSRQQRGQEEEQDAAESDCESVAPPAWPSTRTQAWVADVQSRYQREQQDLLDGDSDCESVAAPAEPSERTQDWVEDMRRRYQHSQEHLRLQQGARQRHLRRNAIMEPEPVAASSSEPSDRTEERVADVRRAYQQEQERQRLQQEERQRHLRAAILDCESDVAASEASEASERTDAWVAGMSSRYEGLQEQQSLRQEERQRHLRAAILDRQQQQQQSQQQPTWQRNGKTDNNISSKDSARRGPPHPIPARKYTLLNADGTRIGSSSEAIRLADVLPEQKRQRAGRVVHFDLSDEVERTAVSPPPPPPPSTPSTPSQDGGESSDENQQRAERTVSREMELLIDAINKELKTEQSEDLDERFEL